ncbi:type II toxin-antitoxin system VapC family toxin [Pelagibius litoralis]|uniref:Ribonuclease VapC n=1 Tax=Pelagibius litoralis TaxID=374515 RepID=A0A967EZW0_9PROT|nr:type II toxin-antitoxin system VapC family toxin [Pelagibius litoralis]NIA70450.1 type II toxin-antitoxin system VapC family toxin [Pelagibius litoralis]
MVVDTSAVIAILWNEPERHPFVAAVQADATRLISAGSALEAAVVVMRRTGPETASRAAAELDAVMNQLGLAIEPVTAAQAGIAREAYRRYGKGCHRAGLNFGDCLAYALAKDSDEPLLFKGGDFALTDVIPVPVKPGTMP